MAETSTTSDTYLTSKGHTSISPDASISCHALLQHEGVRTSKRLRTNSSKALEKPETLHLPSPEIVYERRRVNPESLAIRLGPELVGELNALIVPGNRDMPSFAVRRELQERYDIDRRHLYDYFHSKGLRVVKEDKNGNLIRQTDQAAIVAPQPTLRLLRQAPPKTPMHVHNLPSISSDTKHKVPKHAPKSRAPRQSSIRLKKPAISRKTIAEQSQPPSYLPVESQYSQAQQDYSQFQPIASAPFVPSHYFTNPLQNYFVFGVDDNVTKAGTLDEGSSSTSVFEKMIKQEHMESRLLHPSSKKPDLPASTSQNFVMRTDRQFMSQEERIAFYDFIDSVLGPASGVQESIGTYKAYMAEQSRLYFERILPSSHDHMRKVQAQTYVRSQTTLQPQLQPSADSVDFRKWLVPDGSADSSLDEQRNSVLRYHPYSTHVSDLQRMSSTPNISERALHGAANHFSHTLDDLFPYVKENSLLGGDLGSPVERSNISHDCPISLENWKDYMVDEDEVGVSPTLVMDSPSSQQASPDIESSPIVRTPDSVYQQFIQHKNAPSGFVYSSQPPHGTLTFRGDADSATQFPYLRFQDDHVARKNLLEDVVTKYNTRNLNVPDTVPPTLDHPKSLKSVRTRTRSSGIHVARMRTSSAGGGI